jgi:hypothetical protein
MERYHDNKLTKIHLYEVGQLVWLNVKNVGLRHESMRHKLLPKYWGPFKILELVGNIAIRLDLLANLMRLHPVVSVASIKPFWPCPNQPPPPVIIEGEEECEVDDIIDFNVVRSQRRNIPPIVEFRVRWKGAYDDSWHEPCDLSIRKMFYKLTCNV